MADLVVASEDVAPVRAHSAAIKTGPAGVAIDAGQWVQPNPTTGLIELGDASTEAGGQRGGVALTTVQAGFAVSYLEEGLVDLGDALDALDVGDLVYLSDTAGALGSADDDGTTTKVVGRVAAAYGNVNGPDKLLQVAQEAAFTPAG